MISVKSNRPASPPPTKDFFTEEREFESDESVTKFAGTMKLVGTFTINIDTLNREACEWVQLCHETIARIRTEMDEAAARIFQTDNPLHMYEKIATDIDDSVVGDGINKSAYVCRLNYYLSNSCQYGEEIYGAMQAIEF